MKIETIKCDRCGADIPDGPINTQYNQHTVNAWSSDAVVKNDLCAPCWGDYGIFMRNTATVGPR